MIYYVFQAKMCRSLGRKYNPLPSLISNLNFGPLYDTLEHHTGLEMFGRFPDGHRKKKDKHF